MRFQRYGARKNPEVANHSPQQIRYVVLRNPSLCTLYTLGESVRRTHEYFKRLFRFLPRVRGVEAFVRGFFSLTARHFCAFGRNETPLAQFLLPSFRTLTDSYVSRNHVQFADPGIYDKHPHRADRHSTVRRTAHQEHHSQKSARARRRGGNRKPVDSQAGKSTQ